MQKIRFKTLQGFTFVEIMITVAIIGILIMVVYPYYLDNIRKSRRVDAKVALIELAQLQEDSFITTKQYMDTIVGINGYGNNNYRLSLTTKPNDTGRITQFTLIAEAEGSQAKDTDCFQFKIDSIGNRTAFKKSNMRNDDCW